MKVIIAGSRDIRDEAAVEQAIEDSGFNIREVVCGMAQGVDMLGARWADRNGKPVIPFKADWDRFGRAAGPLRNQEMAYYADALIAIWDGCSAGTFSMIQCAKARGLKIHIHEV